MNKNTNSADDSKFLLKVQTSDNKSSRLLQKARSSRSIGIQKRLTRVKTSPGPADYNFTNFYYNKKGITIPHSNRQSLLNEVKPDPWSYIPNTNSIQPRSPNTTIGREKKLQRFVNAPGPADYRINFKPILQRSKMPVIGSSRKPKQIEDKPGPSDYNTLQADKALKREIKISIGRQQRVKRSNSNSPAPNQYKIQDQFSLKTKNKIGFTMGSRLRIKTESDAPTDFLKYNAEKQVIMTKAPAFSMKKEKKSSFQGSSSPGPAAYSPKSIQRHQNHGITIPNSERQIYNHSQGVGIGKYNIKAVQKSTPLYSIPRANKTQLRFPNVPGPGEYTPQLPKTQKFKSIGIGYGDKFSFMGKQAPGPGKYNISVKQYRQGYTSGQAIAQGQIWHSMRLGQAQLTTTPTSKSQLNFYLPKRRNDTTQLYYLYHCRSVKMNGPIQPWGDENSHIPHKLFHNKKKQNMQKHQSLRQLSKTDCSASPKIRTEYNGLSFRRPKRQNQSSILALEFNSRKQINSNLRTVLFSHAREETFLVGRRNSKKGIQIGCLKKKIIDLDITADRQLLASKAIEKRLRSEPRLDELKQEIQSKLQSNDNSLLIKQVNLTRKPERKTESSLFYKTIAGLNKERSKLGDSQTSSLNEEMQFQRRMFLKKNKRFRSWQTLAKHNYSLHSTRQITPY